MNGVAGYLYQNMLEIPAWICFLIAVLSATWLLAEAIFYGVYRIKVYRSFVTATSFGVSIVMMLSDTSWVANCGIGLAFFTILACVIIIAMSNDGTHRRITF